MDEEQMKRDFEEMAERLPAFPEETLEEVRARFDAMLERLEAAESTAEEIGEKLREVLKDA